MLDKRIKIIIAVAMIPLAIFLWPSFLGGGADFLIVEGNSMLPTILPGSFIITKEQSSYNVGDIVAFYLRGGGLQKIVVHRIIDNTESGFKIQGDNNNKPDTGFFKTDQIIGKVALVIPSVGTLLTLVKNPVVLVITSIVMLMFQMEMKKRKKKKTGEFQDAPLSPTSHSTSYSTSKSRQKMPDNRLFFVASGLNISVYVMQQITLINEGQIGGDIVSGILYSVLDASVASTLTFSLYFLLFVGLYIYAKRAESAQPFIMPTYHAHRYAFTNTRLKKAQVVWMGFSLLLGLHIVSLVGVF